MGPSKFVQLLKLLKQIRELEGLTKNEKLLLFVLASIGDPDGTNIYPRHAYLAACTMLEEDSVGRLMRKLESKGYVEKDGRHGHVRQYRLNIPGATIKALVTPDISRDEWESQFLTDEELQRELDEDKDKTEVRMPAVRAPAPAVPTTPLPAGQPPGLTPEEQYDKAIIFIKYCVDLAKGNKAGMTYERVLKEAQRKGVRKDDVDWLWGFASSGPLGSQPGPESILPEGNYKSH